MQYPSIRNHWFKGTVLVLFSVCVPAAPVRTWSFPVVSSTTIAHAVVPLSALTRRMVAAGSAVRYT